MTALMSLHSELCIQLTEIGKVGTYTFFPSGGLVVSTETGKEYEIAFKYRKDFNVVNPYLSDHLAIH